MGGYGNTLTDIREPARKVYAEDRCSRYAFVLTFDDFFAQLDHQVVTFCRGSGGRCSISRGFYF